MAMFKKTYILLFILLTISCFKKPAKTNPVETLSLEEKDPAYAPNISINLQEVLAGRVSLDLPNVLISDIEMPQMDGLSLCKKIKTDGKLDQITVIMFSSLINKQMLFRCKSVGADDSITKPEMDKLVAMLDRLCLDGSKSQTEEMVL